MKQRKVLARQQRRMKAFNSFDAKKHEPSSSQYHAPGSRKKPAAAGRRK